MRHPPIVGIDPLACSEVPIRLQGIGKCYRIYRSSRDRFKQAIIDLSGRVTGMAGEKLYRNYWALKNISFELQAGEAMGIIGRNGAGKSTLLQIVAGTLGPTEGMIETNGRITALLELGSGFNPEFTGRENVILNAQILGLTRAAVLERFDAIASFADIGDFIDQPVKVYSSGMMMRLAFAVQIAMDPKLLIVDEALAVGDMFFRAKCMAKINQMVASGVALLFVSHDVSHVRQLCKKVVLLQDGRMDSVGETRHVTDYYLKKIYDERVKSACQSPTETGSSQEDGAADPVAEVPTLQGIDTGSLDAGWSIGKEVFEKRSAICRYGSGESRILNVQMLHANACAANFEYDEEVVIRLVTRFFRDIKNPVANVIIRTLQGLGVIFLTTRHSDEMAREFRANRNYIVDWRLRLPLMQGNYILSASLLHTPDQSEEGDLMDALPHAYEFSFSPGNKDLMLGGFVSLPATMVVNELRD